MTPPVSRGVPPRQSRVAAARPVLRPARPAARSSAGPDGPPAAGRGADHGLAAHVGVRPPPASRPGRPARPPAAGRRAGPWGCRPGPLPSGCRSNGSNGEPALAQRRLPSAADRSPVRASRTRPRPSSRRNQRRQAMSSKVASASASRPAKTGWSASITRARCAGPAAVRNRRRAGQAQSGQQGAGQVAGLGRVARPGTGPPRRRSATASRPARARRPRGSGIDEDHHVAAARSPVVRSVGRQRP